MSAAPAFPRVTIAQIMGLVAVVAVGCAAPTWLWVVAGLTVTVLATTFALFAVVGRHASLLDILVLIAFLGVLVGLFLPAQQTHCRRSSRPMPTPTVAGATDATGDETLSIDQEAR